MELKTSRTLPPKDVYMDFITAYVERNPELTIVKLKFQHRIAMPYVVQDSKGNVVLTFDRWYNVMVVFFTTARTKIVEGQRLYMGKAGSIYPKRIERNYSNKKINWKATNEQPKVWNEEKQKWVPKHRIYFTEPDYCRIAWERPFRNVYKFEPTHSSKYEKGFKEQFSFALKTRPTLKFKYPYSPYNHGI